MQEQITIADILNEYGESYISQNNIRGQQKGLIHLLVGLPYPGIGQPL